MNLVSSVFAQPFEDLIDVVLVVTGVLGISWTNSFLTYTGVNPKVTAQKLTIIENLN